jgi:hypothetical protein
MSVTVVDWVSEDFSRIIIICRFQGPPARDGRCREIDGPPENTAAARRLWRATERQRELATLCVDVQISGLSSGFHYEIVMLAFSFGSFAGCYPLHIDNQGETS